MKSFVAKNLILFCFLIGVYLPTIAQEPCTPIQQTSEVLLNLQLGMSVAEVNNKLGKVLKIQANTDDDYRFFQNYINRQPPKNLSGVRAIYLRFFEKKLYQVEIFYEENKYPSDIKSFSEIISNQLSLSVADWKFAHRQAVLRCGEKSLTADYQLNPRIELTDEIIRKQVAEKNKSINSK